MATLVHIAEQDSDRALCGAQTGEVLTREQAEASGGRHFTCGDCHAELTDGRPHVEPPAESA